MNTVPHTKSPPEIGVLKCFKIGGLALIAVIGFDLLLHGGVLAPLYSHGTSFLLEPKRAFQLIPLGYLSFALTIGLMVWLMHSLGIRTWARGARFGFILGGLLWASIALGLASISTARPALLVAWCIGQTLELAYAGAVIGIGMGAERLRRLAWTIVGISVATAIIGIVIQNLWSLRGGI
jgi:hypothetical protein